ncbi:MAG: helix-turn-helix transcriptional regulator [Hyphomicrobium sp.]|uniref:winged helix-turn-helix transcriptional regulator n=1 Tax=Hyphomicrobium sp. TaxID=82 RepID=UPI0025B96334|nr:helix-turn-helix domain-containing protein [Hyphomicrobium sp.]MBX9864887.1 helix-turn-helix transcriptional regulator [Hyphomicrobium sp.]
MKWNPYAAGCPTRQLLDRISDKWVVLVLSLLEGGPKRFSVLKREIDGISQKMLSQTLRALEQDGLLTRRAFPTVPVTVEYELTPLGRSLNVAMAPVVEWAVANMSRVLKARDTFERKTS